MTTEFKKIELSISIKNPRDRNLSKNKESYILNVLNKKLVSMCYNGCFIHKIHKILHMSTILICDTDLSMSGNIDVRFIANVSEFRTGDFISGVTIKNTQPFLYGDYVKSTIHGDVSATVAIPQGINIGPLPLEKTIRGIKVHQIIPMRIIEAHHKCFNSIVISATLLVCENTFNKYVIRTPLSQIFFDNINPILDEINIQLQIRNDLINGEDEDSKKNILFFESLLYSYKNKIKTTMEINSDGFPVWWGLEPIRPITNEINLLEFFKTGSDISSSNPNYKKHPKGFKDSKKSAFKKKTAADDTAAAEVAADDTAEVAADDTAAAEVAADDTADDTAADDTAAEDNTAAEDDTTTEDDTAAEDDTANIIYKGGNSLNVIGVWSRPLHIFKTCPLAMREDINDKILEEANILEEGNADTVFIRFFKDMLNYLQVINKMAEQYPDKASIMANKNIWDGMEEVQIIP